MCVRILNLGSEHDTPHTRLKASTFFVFFSSRRRHTRFDCDWSSDVCSSDLQRPAGAVPVLDDAVEIDAGGVVDEGDRKSTRLNSSHSQISYAVFCLKKKIGAAGSEAPGADRATRCCRHNA